MSILFRLFRLVILLALILVVVGVIGFVVGRPFVERLAARSIEDRIGTPVSVSIATSVEPGVLRGELGNVTVDRGRSSSGTGSGSPAPGRSTAASTSTSRT